MLEDQAKKTAKSCGNIKRIKILKKIFLSELVDPGKLFRVLKIWFNNHQ
jgi:hypothetical protein